jgi:hypothetical protein
LWRRYLHKTGSSTRRAPALFLATVPIVRPPRGRRSSRTTASTSWCAILVRFAYLLIDLSEISDDELRRPGNWLRSDVSAVHVECHRLARPSQKGDLFR